MKALKVRTKEERPKRKNPRKKLTTAEILRNIQIARALANAPDELEMDLALTCLFFGGTHPIDPSTLYRGTLKGIYPAAEKTGPNMRRWNLGKCRTAKARNAQSA